MSTTTYFLLWNLLVTSLLTTVSRGETNVPVTGHWFDGFQAEACIPITKELRGWKAHLKFTEEVHSIDIWAANQNYNGEEHVGDSLCFSFVGHVTGNVVPKITIYIEGMDRGGGGGRSQGWGELEGLSLYGGGTANKDYKDALAKSILFYNAQRSGKLPANNPITWRGDSALNDCVPGGWYDAGDHVKFGLPMASAATMLLWSLYSFKDGYTEAKTLDAMYDMIRWPLDYFLKAWNPNTKRLVVQVGDGDADHSYWGRPEQMTMARPCQEVSTSSPGSDVAGETAAALALGAITFKDKGDTTYATQLLTAAESLYAFAKSSRFVALNKVKM
ncbi:unnamed protein product [Candidula unifasciata]|uniref:cellulase n=1 Tax=Candidula unifasciata TaxID=100452 RepID=A0A8S3YI12_9EUPU|nr:unnamed protein product [Candidula unifasciata]